MPPLLRRTSQPVVIGACRCKSENQSALASDEGEQVLAKHHPTSPKPHPAKGWIADRAFTGTQNPLQITGGIHHIPEDLPGVEPH